jgi:2-succinyl-5-enolpyruvyl-6-hydroxy-3-cyclohexene-1-carboxylate synthase
VLVFGVPTLTREVPALIQRDGVETIVVTTGESETYNPGRRVKHVVNGVTLGAEYDRGQAHDWLGEWVVRDRELTAMNTTVHEPNLEAAREPGYKERSAYAKAEVAAKREPVTRAMLAEAIWRATWPHDRLVLGASRLIRVLDSVAQPRNIRVISNRGLAGIDGTISTAAGVAVASQAEGEAGATRALLGDITALHDVGGLFWGAGEGQPRLQLFVGNDGGGAIFDALEVAATTEPAAFDRVMFTPQQVSFEHLAAAYGWGYQRVTNRGELDAVLTAPVVGLSIIEVTLQRNE